MSIENRDGGTISQQDTATATIKAIDAKVPSVSVLTEDGRTVSFAAWLGSTRVSTRPPPRAGTS